MQSGPPAHRLSSPIEDIAPSYDVVVVGSGYGAAIAASRLARTGRSVCLLERGKELQPGEYPDTLTEALGELQIDSPGAHLGPKTGLYDFRRNADMNVFLGCGLGGTSLVNANVALRAEPRVFDDEAWPPPLRGDPHALDGYYGRAEAMLAPTPYPDGFPPLAKLEALETAGEHGDGEFSRPPITVTFADGPNAAGVHQQACTLCGDCVTGCNYGSKNTTLMNYLPDARAHGAHIFTRVRVRRVQRSGDRWLVHYQLLEAGRETFDAPPLFVAAGVVVLGAGALGSTEILLRSAQAGLAVSPRLGRGFTGNGDALGFAYDCDEPVNGFGFGDRPVTDGPPVGPCITGLVDLREQPTLGDGMVIEEGVVPGAVSSMVARVLRLGAQLGLKDRLAHTLTYLVMTHDDAAGRMRLEDDRLRIHWPGVGGQPIFQRVHERLTQATEALGGTYVRNPIWSQLLGQDLVTVHPLGGCGMGAAAEAGVVDERGRVFAGAEGTEVHDGLYVCDGSIVPRSLGVNPFLTISALAERVCELLARDRGWAPGGAAAPGGADGAGGEGAAGGDAVHVGIRFTETMRGFLSTAVTDDYEQARDRGRDDGSTFVFTLTVVSDDLDRLIEHPGHEGRIVGTVEAPALSAHPLTATDGIFNLFVADPGDPGARRMRYRMRLTSQEGRTLYFEGFKRLHDDPGFDQWADTTTLFITVHDGDSEAAPVLGRGILTIRPDDFARQLTTMAATNASSVSERVAATARFGAYFAGAVKDVYGLL